MSTDLYTSILQLNGFVPHYTTNRIINALKTTIILKLTSAYLRLARIVPNRHKTPPFNGKWEHLELWIIKFIAAVCQPQVFHGLQSCDMNDHYHSNAHRCSLQLQLTVQRAKIAGPMP